MSVWTLSLRPGKDVQANAGMEIRAVSGLSADKIAARRAPLILLDESPQAQGGIGDRMLESMICGLSSDLKMTEGAFP